MAKKKLMDPELVVAIREMARAGMIYRAIGHEFEISHVAVSDIVNGLAYPAFGGPIRGQDYAVYRTRKEKIG